MPTAPAARTRRRWWVLRRPARWGQGKGGEGALVGEQRKQLLLLSGKHPAVHDHRASHIRSRLPTFRRRSSASRICRSRSSLARFFACLDSFL